MNGNVGAVWQPSGLRRKGDCPTCPQRSQVSIEDWHSGNVRPVPPFRCRSGRFFAASSLQTLPLGSSPPTSSRREVVYRERDVITCFPRKGREPNRILYLVTGSSEKPSLTSDEMLSKITRFARGLFPINSTDIGFSFGGMCGNAENRQFRGVLLLRHISKLLQEEVVGAT